MEAHGTGTVVGDAQELAAIDRMYGAGVGRSADAPLLIGSVKSNMGHCEGCSGLAGVLPSPAHISAPKASTEILVICATCRAALAWQTHWWQRTNSRMQAPRAHVCMRGMTLASALLGQAQGRPMLD